MSDLLTPSVNVPAEREKLRRLRDEIAADVEHRKQLERLYSVRGFRRIEVQWPCELRVPQVLCPTCGQSKAASSASGSAVSCHGEVPRQRLAQVQPSGAVASGVSA